MSGKHHCKNQEAGLLGGLWDGWRTGMYNSPLQEASILVTEEGRLFLSFCEKKAGCPGLHQNTRMKSQNLSETLRPASNKPHITHGELHLLLPLGTTDIAKSFANHNSFHIVFSVPAEKSDLLWEVSTILLELSAANMMACNNPAV